MNRDRRNPFNDLREDGPIDSVYGCPLETLAAVRSLRDGELPIMFYGMFTKIVVAHHMAHGGNVATLNLARIVLADECIARGLLSAGDVHGDYPAWRAECIQRANGLIGIGATLH